eukprot:365902-Chlamydomonas_euryale.AAC.7
MGRALTGSIPTGSGSTLMMECLSTSHSEAKCSKACTAYILHTSLSVKARYLTPLSHINHGDPPRLLSSTDLFWSLADVHCIVPAVQHHPSAGCEAGDAADRGAGRLRANRRCVGLDGRQRHVPAGVERVQRDLGVGYVGVDGRQRHVPVGVEYLRGDLVVELLEVQEGVTGAAAASCPALQWCRMHTWCHTSENIKSALRPAGINPEEKAMLAANEEGFARIVAAGADRSVKNLEAAYWSTAPLQAKLLRNEILKQCAR